MSEDNTSAPQPAAPTYNVKVTGNGVTVDKNVSEAIAAEVIRYVMASENQSRVAPAGPRAITTPAAPAVASATATDRPVSLSEYLEDINATRIPERILGMAAWLTEVV